MLVKVGCTTESVSHTQQFLSPLELQQLNLTVMVKLNLSKIMLMIFNIRWWIHVQYFEDGKIGKNADYYFIWECVLWHPKEYSHFLFLFCACAVLVNFQLWVRMGIISLWEGGFHSILKKQLHGNHRKLQKKVPVIVWKHCGLWRWKPEHGFASKFYKLLETWMTEKQMQKVCLKKKS